MLQFQHVRKSYPGQPVLDIPDVRLPGGIFWIRGANGSGKTTLLKMIAGLIPFQGDILYSGISLKKQPLAYRRQVGWAEAEPLFPEFVTGKELIALFRSCRHAGKEEADELVSLFGMSAYIGNLVGTYSSGMVKKLAIVLALLGKPALVVLDEPLITLDPESLDILVQLIHEKHRQLGTNFLLSSHLEWEAGRPRDRHLLVAGHTLQFHS